MFLSDEDWGGVTLDEFTSCPHNLANNRQTRMLANLSKIHCYNKTAMSEAQRNALMLESAKENLRNMAFFGITEYQRETQVIIRPQPKKLGAYRFGMSVGLSVRHTFFSTGLNF